MDAARHAAPRLDARSSPAIAAAALSFGAALVHASVIVTHFREYWLFGLFFAIVTPLQVLWAGLVAGRPADRRLLLAGAAGNLAVALVWVVSRVTGLPLGPHAFEPEPVGAKDLLATYAEFGVAALVLCALRGRSLPGPALAGVWLLAAACVVAAFLAGGH